MTIKRVRARFPGRLLAVQRLQEPKWRWLRVESCPHSWLRSNNCLITILNWRTFSCLERLVLTLNQFWKTLVALFVCGWPVHDG